MNNSSPTALEEEAEVYEGELSLHQSYTTHYPPKNPCEILINDKPFKKTQISSHRLCRDALDFHCAVLQRSSVTDRCLTKVDKCTCMF